MTPRAPTKLLAEWFWTDRWIGSSAFGLPLEARGLYREMLTQAWRRGARLPNDPAQVRRLAGVTTSEWRRSWPLVERFWRVDGESLVNDTQLEVYADASARSQRASARGLSGAQALLKRRLSGAQALLKHQPPSPSPSPSKEQKEQVISAEPSNGSTPPVLTFPTVGTSRTSWGLTPKQIAAWSDAFPGVSVEGECRRALAWIEAQPTRRKTPSGMPRFLVGWLNRATDRPSGPRRDQPRGAAPMPVHAQVDCPHVAAHTNAAACLLACHLGQPRADGRAVRRWTEADAREGFTGLDADRG